MEGVPDSHELSKQDDARLARLAYEFRAGCEATHRDSPLPDLTAFLPGRDEQALRATVLWSLMGVDLKFRWDRGERILLETYVTRFTETLKIEEIPTSLIVDEFSLRRSHGEKLSLLEYRSRFAQQFPDFQKLAIESGLIPNLSDTVLTDSGGTTADEDSGLRGAILPDPVSNLRQTPVTSIQANDESAVWSIVESQLDAFFRRWEAAPPPPELGKFVADFDGEVRRLILADLVKVDIEYRWKDPSLVKPIAAYLAEWPELTNDSAVTAELLHEEILQRQQNGEHADIGEYVQLYPESAEALKRISNEVSSSAPHTIAPAPSKLSSSVGDGRYILRRALGSGAFGEVWLGEAPGGIEVAVKIIGFPLGHHMTRQEHRALQVMKKMRHPFLIQVQAYWEEDDHLIIVMDLAEKTLRDRFKECRNAGQGGIPQSELIEYMHAAGEALDFLHSRDVIHRDVKPANLLLTGTFAKVGDFGLARVLERHDASMQATIAGTPLYTAPEMFDGKPGPKSDQYALAVSYFELRTGRPPLVGHSIMELMKAHVSQKPDLSALDETEQPIVHRALAKNPTDRYENCVAFAEALRGIAHQPPTVKPKQLFPLVALLLLVIATTAFLVSRQSSKRILKPANCVESPGAKLVQCDIMNAQLYDEVILELAGTKIPLRLIHGSVGNESNTATFYIMKNKVSNRLYTKVMEARQDDEDTKCDLEFAKQPDYPVFCITATEAHEFASKINGRLPTPAQWDKAAGKFDAPQGTMGPYNLQLSDSNNPESIAINRTTPLPVGKATADKSFFLVNDMSGNGLEWTNEVYWKEANHLLSDIVSQLVEEDWATVTTRGVGYTNPSPYEFMTENELPTAYFYRDREVSFRVVIQVSGSPAGK